MLKWGTLSVFKKFDICLRGVLANFIVIFLFLIYDSVIIFVVKQSSCENEWQSKVGLFRFFFFYSEGEKLVQVHEVSNLERKLMFEWNTISSEV